MSHRRLRLLTAATALALASALAACSPHHTTAPATPGAPVADSPENAVSRLAWSWDQRDTTAYLGLLTGDFAFVFAPSDSAGDPWQGHAWPLADEVLSARHVFTGSAGWGQPIVGVTITLLDPLEGTGDPRAGTNPGLHRVVRALADLSFELGDPAGDFPVTARGYETFYLVRGDSAAVHGLPPGAVANASRWYVQRWEEQALVPGSAASASTASPWPTWGSFKRRYHG